MHNSKEKHVPFCTYQRTASLARLYKSGFKLTQMAFGRGMKSAALVWWEKRKKANLL